MAQTITEALMDLAKENPESKGMIEAYAKRMEAAQKGGATSWKSTQYPKQTIRVTMKIDIPPDANIKELVEEMKNAELRLNKDTEFAFKIEFGTWTVDKFDLVG